MEALKRGGNMSREIKVVSRGGIGFWSLLAIVLIALKLTGHIQISWWLIVACMFAPMIIVLSFMACGLIVVAGIALLAVVAEFISSKGKK